MLRMFLITTFALLPAPLLAKREIDFNRDVRPILSDRCFQCHGPDEEQRQAELRLDLADGEEGASTVIQKGAAEESELWHRIISSDPDLVMPPPESNKPPLNAAEQATLKKWIDQGADYADFWAFVPPSRPNLENTPGLHGSM